MGREAAGYVRFPTTRYWSPSRSPAVAGTARKRRGRFHWRALAKREDFASLGFQAAPEVEKLLTGEIEGIAGLTQEAETIREHSGEDHASGESTDWSVSRLNEEVRLAILQGMPKTLWLQGEVMGADRSLGRGSNASHLYFRLVEKEQGADRPRAEVSAVMWNFRRDASFRKLEENGTPLEDGLKIRVKVRLDLYVARGQYQVTVEEIDPEFTLGELARRREEILAEVRRLGVERNNLDQRCRRSH